MMVALPRAPVVILVARAALERRATEAISEENIVNSWCVVFLEVWFKSRDTFESEAELRAGDTEEKRLTTAEELC